jgi:hypothetical protein
MRGRLLLGLVVVLAMGCTSRKYVPVSGRVTMNGKPLANATVSFQPIAREGAVEAAGAGSTGKTDANGEFTLKNIAGQDGALVGEHRVLISLLTVKEEDGDRRRGGPPQMDVVPAQYNRDSKLTFTVPPGGTKNADFPLKSP